MANQLVTLSYASTNVTTGAYVTLVASTTVATNSILASDTSGSLMKLAVGKAGSEVDLFQIPVNATGLLPVPAQTTIPVGSRISIRAIDASATTGFNAITLLS